MKLRNLILLILVGISTSSFTGLKADNKTKISFLKQHYSTALILQGIDQVLEHDGFGLSIIQKEAGDNYSHYQQKAETMVMSHPNILDIAFSNVTNKKESAEIIEHITDWCGIFVTISQLQRLDASIHLEQVLYEIPSSKVIIDSFLTSDDQTWASLSSAQLTMLPYVATSLLYKKSEEERLQFYRDFHAKVLELATDDGN